VGSRENPAVLPHLFGAEQNRTQRLLHAGVPVYPAAAKA